MAEKTWNEKFGELTPEQLERLQTMTTPQPSDKCRVCENPLDTHTGHDLDRCEKQADRNEVLRRLIDEREVRRHRQISYLRRQQ